MFPLAATLLAILPMAPPAPSPAPPPPPLAHVVALAVPDQPLPDGFLDALRGSTTSRVVAHAPCPVLTLPLVGV